MKEDRGLDRQIRNALEPRMAEVNRVIDGALEAEGRPAWAVGGWWAGAAVAAILVLAPALLVLRSEPPAPEEAAFRIGNAGGVVEISQAGGRAWLIHSSGREAAAAGQIIIFGRTDR